MHTIDWLIVIVLNGSVIAYGFYLAGGAKSSSEWFLGRRALPWWVIGMSMFATNVDNADIVSVTGKTFNQGLHILTVYALGSAAGGILAAFFVVPAIYRAGFYTNAEYLEARFGVAARVLSALIQIQYRTSMLGADDLVHSLALGWLKYYGLDAGLDSDRRACGLLGTVHRLWRAQVGCLDRCTSRHCHDAWRGRNLLGRVVRR